MSIKDITGFQKTLGNADAKGWSRSVDNDFGKGFGIEAPGINGTEGGTKSFGEFLQDSIGKVNSLKNDELLNLNSTPSKVVRASAALSAWALEIFNVSSNPSSPRASIEAPAMVATKD